MLEGLKRGLKQVLADAQVHAADTIKAYKPLDTAESTRKVGVTVKPARLLLDVGDSVELLTAAEARQLAAALVEAADVLERAGKSGGGAP